MWQAKVVEITPPKTKENVLIKDILTGHPGENLARPVHDHPEPKRQKAH